MAFHHKQDNMRLDETAEHACRPSDASLVGSGERFRCLIGISPFSFSLYHSLSLSLSIALLSSDLVFFPGSFVRFSFFFFNLMS